MTSADTDPGRCARYAVRPAEPRDAPAVRDVHVQTWLSTYHGLIPEGYLEKLASSCPAWFQWSDRLTSPGSSHIFVGEETNDGVIGFCWSGPEAKQSSTYTGEIYAMYVRADHQRKGVGRTLMAAAARSLEAEGHRNLLIWVVAENPYRAFYEKHGGRPVDRQRQELEGIPLDLIGYGWNEDSFGRLTDP
jgi:GNAT superfamily N-acetyltransferase